MRGVRGELQDERRGGARGTWGVILRTCMLPLPVPGASTASHSCLLILPAPGATTASHFCLLLLPVPGATTSSHIHNPATACA